MKKRGIIYLIVTIVFIFLTILILRKTDMSNNVMLSKSVQIILILALIRISIGCSFYIKNQYEQRKYDYKIIMNLGLLIFINVNILRQINLLIQNWNVLNIVDIYMNTLKSFSFFAMLTLPCIIVLSIYCIITNVILIKKEGFSPRRSLGIILGAFALIGLLGSQGIYLLLKNALLGTQDNNLRMNDFNEYNKNQPDFYYTGIIPGQNGNYQNEPTIGDRLNDYGGKVKDGLFFVGGKIKDTAVSGFNFVRDKFNDDGKED